MNFADWKSWVGKVKLESYALYIAYKGPRVPLYAKLFVALIVGLAFSPIDLVPDFIPVLGYLDDIIVVPLGAWLSRYGWSPPT